MNLGESPTPMGQWVAKQLKARATFAVTASHNPAAQNGLKYMFGHDKPDDKQVRAVSDTYYANLNNPQDYLAPEDSKPVRSRELTDWYHDEVVATVAGEFGDDILKDKVFVYDGAQGAAKEITPRVLRSLGATVYEFACDGSDLINNGCGAANLAEATTQKPSGIELYLRKNPQIVSDPNFVGALANDGDGDRVMGLAVRRGNASVDTKVINGNHFMWALAQGEQAGGIVGTEYTNGGLQTALKRAGIAFESCNNGDRHVTQALRRHQTAGEPWYRGGEFTGHLIDTRWLGSGDGTFMAAWYAADTAKRAMTFADRHEELPLLAENMVNIEVSSAAKAQAYLASDEFELEHAMWQSAISREAGRFLIRASGTEAKVRIWGEARKQDTIERATAYVAQIIQKHILA